MNREMELISIQPDSLSLHHSPVLEGNLEESVDHENDANSKSESMTGDHVADEYDDDHIEDSEGKVFEQNHLEGQNTNEQESKTQNQYEITAKNEPKKTVRHSKISQKRMQRTVHSYLQRRQPVPGRKMMDPDMEPKVLCWIQRYAHVYGTMPDKQLIKTTAREFNLCSNFKASKGWLDKFFKRNHEFIYGIQKKFKTDPEHIFMPYQYHIQTSDNDNHEVLRMKLRRDRKVLANFPSPAHLDQPSAIQGGPIKRLKFK